TAYRHWSAAGPFSGRPRSPDPLLGSAAIAWYDGPYHKPESTCPSSRCHSGGGTRYLLPEDPNGPVAVRSLGPVGRRLRLDRRKRSGVPHLWVEGSVAEKPDASEPRWEWRHPTRRRIAPRRSGNAGTCEVP